MPLNSTQRHFARTTENIINWILRQQNYQWIFRRRAFVQFSRRSEAKHVNSITLKIKINGWVSGSRAERFQLELKPEQQQPQKKTLDNYWQHQPHLYWILWDEHVSGNSQYRLLHKSLNYQVTFIGSHIYCVYRRQTNIR